MHSLRHQCSDYDMGGTRRHRSYPSLPDTARVLGRNLICCPPISIHPSCSLRNLPDLCSSHGRSPMRGTPCVSRMPGISRTMPLASDSEARQHHIAGMY
ncbi:hypothetical protein AVEN_41903-1 [Araneus ventricosus]|uniref:Uncharacterized protein n=1 Tax=Araneus ventricosus TaxID=182803 RepID=A0A4Y2AE81_ARAVE|nr:hypothetical protein AVEN_41903-1 [Araneus ventricosus]